MGRVMATGIIDGLTSRGAQSLSDGDSAGAGRSLPRQQEDARRLVDPIRCGVVSPGPPAARARERRGDNQRPGRLAPSSDWRFKADI